MRVAVAGATGWTGVEVVRALRERGHESVVIARSGGVDLLTGAGLADALEGVEAVVDVTNVRTQRYGRARAFFETATTTLIRAEVAAGVRHHVVLSIIGCDRVDLGYYRAKHRQERAALAGPVPVTVLRAAQFHELAAQMLATRAPVVLAPPLRCQPVAMREVAAHLAELAVRGPQGMAPEMAGPDADQRLDQMMRRLAQRRGVRRPLLPVLPPGRAGRQITAGALLPAADGPRGEESFEDWLAQVR